MAHGLILLIEDDRALAEILTRNCQRYCDSNSVLVFHDGQQALDYLLDGRQPLPDLVLLDLNLPHLHGMDLLVQLRQDERTHRLKIIIVTASGDAFYFGKSISLGVEAYLQKPVYGKTLAQALHSLHILESC